jgi:hypothetical protein
VYTCLRQSGSHSLLNTFIGSRIFPHQLGCSCNLQLYENWQYNLKHTQTEKVVFSSHSAIFAVPENLSSEQPLHHNLLHMISLLRNQQTVGEMCNLPAIVQELLYGLQQAFFIERGLRSTRDT